MTDDEKLIAVLNETLVPHTVDYDGNYVTITIEANASDKYVTVTFKDGQFAFSN